MSSAIWWWLNPRWTELVRIVIPSNNYSNFLFGEAGTEQSCLKLLNWSNERENYMIQFSGQQQHWSGRRRRLRGKHETKIRFILCSSIVARFPLELMVSSRFLSDVWATIIQQFPCLMINIMLDIPSININAPFQVLWTKWPNLTAQKIYRKKSSSDLISFE